MNPKDPNAPDFAAYKSEECEGERHESCVWVMDTMDGTKACPCDCHASMVRTLFIDGEELKIVVSGRNMPTWLSPEEIDDVLAFAIHIAREQEKARKKAELN